VRQSYFRRDFEWHLLLLSFCLTLIGIAFIWSSTRDSLLFAGKPIAQAVFTGVAVPVLLVIFRVGYLNIKTLAYPAYGTVLFLLVFLQATGGSGQQAIRWFDLGFGLKLQPSEFMKVTLVLALARYLMYKRDWFSFSGLVMPFAMTLTPMVLIAIQPDLGTALLFLPVLFGMLYIAGARTGHLLALIAAGIVLLPMLYNSPLVKDYQKERVTSFLQRIPGLQRTAEDLYQQGKKREARQLEERIRQLKQGIGYQQYFSQVSIGSGGGWGQGFGSGPQNRLNYIPESHTDFIFAIIGEEWGFLGSSTLLVLYLLTVAIIFGIAKRTREPFGRYVCCGVGILIGFQVVVNTAIAVGLLPIAGLTLPFVSYGGSSLITSFIAVGLVLDVGARRVRELGR